MPKNDITDTTKLSLGHNFAIAATDAVPAQEKAGQLEVTGGNPMDDETDSACAEGGHAQPIREVALHINTEAALVAGTLLRCLAKQETRADVARLLLHAGDGLLEAALGRTTGETLAHLSSGVRADNHHGGLPQLLGKSTGQPITFPKQGTAVNILGGEDLDDVGVFEFSSPETSGLSEGGADELGARQVHQGATQGNVTDSLTGLIREVRPDVEPNGTRGDALISTVLTSHESILHKLKARGKYRSNHCYLYFEVERKKKLVRIETSWLPNLSPVHKVLVPLGFAREASGSWSARVEIGDFVGVVRRVTQALELLLTEATQLIEAGDNSESEGLL